MEIVFLWVLLAVVVAVAASNRGRSGFGWLILSLLISPFISGLLLLASKNLATSPVLNASGEEVSPSTHVRCPECRELVRADARKCKHCGIALIPQQL